MPPLRTLSLPPITKLRYDHPLQEGIVKYNHITLCRSRWISYTLRPVQLPNLICQPYPVTWKEIALRKVCGSSDKHLMGLFSVEYLPHLNTLNLYRHVTDRDSITFI